MVKYKQHNSIHNLLKEINPKAFESLRKLQKHRKNRNFSYTKKRRICSLCNRVYYDFPSAIKRHNNTKSHLNAQKLVIKFND